MRFVHAISFTGHGHASAGCCNDLGYSIPMGIWAAVYLWHSYVHHRSMYLAKLYLFCYVFEFIQESLTAFVDEQSSKALNDFQHAGCFHFRLCCNCFEFFWLN